MTNPEIDKFGIKRWYRNGQLHRGDGPAAVWANGREAGWLNGKRHREASPAAIFPNGKKNGESTVKSERLWNF